MTRSRIRNPSRKTSRAPPFSLRFPVSRLRGFAVSRCRGFAVSRFGQEISRYIVSVMKRYTIRYIETMGRAKEGGDPEVKKRRRATNRPPGVSAPNSTGFAGYSLSTRPNYHHAAWAGLAGRWIVAKSWKACERAPRTTVQTTLWTKPHYLRILKTLRSVAGQICRYSHPRSRRSYNPLLSPPVPW